MPFKKNDKNINRAGRPKGSANLNGEEIRDVLKDMLFEVLEKINIDKLSERDKINLAMKLASFAVPQPLNELERLSNEQFEQLVKELKEQQRNHLKAV